MALTEITPQMLQGKGVTNLPDVPGLTTEEMQAKFDELSRDVITPAFNANVQTLQAETATQEIGAQPPAGITADPQPAEGQPTKLAAVLQGIINFVKQFVKEFAYSKTQTDAQIDAKVVEIGTGDMAKAKYDANNDGIVNAADKAAFAQTAENAKAAIRATVAENATYADNGFFAYVHTKKGTVHELLGTGENIKFVATADLTQGDTFTLNGTEIEAENQSGQPLGTGAIKTGDMVFGIQNGNKIKLFCRLVPYLLWSGSAANNIVITSPHISKFNLIAPDNLPFADIKNSPVFVTAPVSATMQMVINLSLIKLTETTIQISGAFLVHVVGSGHEYFRNDFIVRKIWGM